MKAFDFCLNLLFPPSCVSCKEILPCDTTEALCPLCRAKFENEKEYLCPECHFPHLDCNCMPPMLSLYAKEAIHLAEYTKEESTARAITLAAKDTRYSYLYRFLAKELASVVKKRVDTEGLLITYVPRSQKKVAKHGVDQAKDAAKALAKVLGCECVSLFKHRKNREQKKLSRKERAVNARGSYYLSDKKRALLAERRVLIYDDVMTTGATLSACASLAKRAGADEVFVLSFSKTYVKNKKDSADLPKSKRDYFYKPNRFPG